MFIHPFIRHPWGCSSSYQWVYNLTTVLVAPYAICQLSGVITTYTDFKKKTHTVNTDQWPVLHFVLGPVHIGPPCQRTPSIGSWKLPVSYLFSPLRPLNPGIRGPTGQTHSGIWGLGSTNDHQLSYFIIPVHIYHPYSKKHKLPTTHLMEPGRVSMKSFWKQLPPNMVRNKPRNGRLICSTSEVLKIGESHWCHGDTVTKRQKNASKNLGTTRSNKH